MIKKTTIIYTLLFILFSVLLLAIIIDSTTKGIMNKEIIEECRIADTNQHIVPTNTIRKDFNGMVNQ